MQRRITCQQGERGEREVRAAVDAAIDRLVSEQERLSLGDGVRLLAIGEGVTQRMLMGATPQLLVEDLRCAGCEQAHRDREGYAGLCDGCLEALEGDA